MRRQAGGSALLQAERASGAPEDSVPLLLLILPAKHARQGDLPAHKGGSKKGWGVGEMGGEVEDGSGEVRGGGYKFRLGFRFV